MNDLLTISGSEIARRIRARTLSSREAVEAHIAQIERVNPTINAVVSKRYDLARKEADAADEAVRTGRELPPFHGVPCTVKECFELEGMPNTGGILKRKEVIAVRDATAVARVRKQGAIPLGVTNTSELCFWMESVNPVYGRTNNPYDPRHICGGSSGGEAAIIGAGGSPFGVGSDIGGSIRGPAFFNGVFGHKPTGGLVPGTGQMPPCAKDARRILTTGPIARRAEDLMPLLRIMAGPDGADVGCFPMALGDPNAVDLGAIHIVNVPDNGKMSVSDDLRAAQAAVVAALAARGMQVRTARFTGLQRQFDIWTATMAATQDVPFATLLGDGTKVRALRELLKWTVGRSNHTIMPILAALTEPLTEVFSGQRDTFVAHARELRTELSEAIGPNGVMLYPTYSTPAPRHHEAVWHALRFHFPFAHQGIFNVLEFPSTQVPLGLNKAGLPVGCQVIATPGNDHLTIAVAIELERIFGGWTMPKREVARAS